MAYEPRVLPQGNGPAGELAAFVQDELRRIAETFQGGLDHLPLSKVWHEEPPKPRDTMIIYVDGTDFNPGAGLGFYGRENGAWVKL